MGPEALQPTHIHQFTFTDTHYLERARREETTTANNFGRHPGSPLDPCKQLWQTPWIPSRSQSPVLLPLSHPASVLGLLGLNRGSVSSVRVLMNTPCEALQLSIVTHSLPTVKSLEQKPVHFRLFSLLPT